MLVSDPVNSAFLLAGHSVKAYMFDLDNQQFCNFPEGGIDFKYGPQGAYFPERNETIGIRRKSFIKQIQILCVNKEIT